MTDSIYDYFTPPPPSPIDDLDDIDEISDPYVSSQDSDEVHQLISHCLIDVEFPNGYFYSSCHSSSDWYKCDIVDAIKLFLSFWKCDNPAAKDLFSIFHTNKVVQLDEFCSICRISINVSSLPMIIVVDSSVWEFKWCKQALHYTKTDQCSFLFAPEIEGDVAANDNHPVGDQLACQSTCKKSWFEAVGGTIGDIWSFVVKILKCARDKVMGGFCSFISSWAGGLKYVTFSGVVRCLFAFPRFRSILSEIKGLEWLGNRMDDPANYVYLTIEMFQTPAIFILDYVLALVSTFFVDFDRPIQCDTYFLRFLVRAHSLIAYLQQKPWLRWLKVIPTPLSYVDISSEVNFKSQTLSTVEVLSIYHTPAIIRTNPLLNLEDRVLMTRSEFATHRRSLKAGFIVEKHQGDIIVRTSGYCSIVAQDNKIWQLAPDMNILDFVLNQGFSSGSCSLTCGGKPLHSKLSNYYIGETIHINISLLGGAGKKKKSRYAPSHGPPPPPPSRKNVGSNRKNSSGASSSQPPDNINNPHQIVPPQPCRFLPPIELTIPESNISIDDLAVLNARRLTRSNSFNGIDCYAANGIKRVGARTRDDSQSRAIHSASTVNRKKQQRQMLEEHSQKLQEELDADAQEAMLEQEEERQAKMARILGDKRVDVKTLNSTVMVSNAIGYCPICLTTHSDQACLQMLPILGIPKPHPHAPLSAPFADIHFFNDSNHPIDRSSDKLFYIFELLKNSRDVDTLKLVGGMVFDCVLARSLNPIVRGVSRSWTIANVLDPPEENFRSCQRPSLAAVHTVKGHIATGMLVTTSPGVNFRHSLHISVSPEWYLSTVNDFMLSKLTYPAVAALWKTSSFIYDESLYSNVVNGTWTLLSAMRGDLPFPVSSN